jgi:hypothetical protein
VSLAFARRDVVMGEGGSCQGGPVELSDQTAYRSMQRLH